MTAQELKNKLDNEFGFNKWPDTYEVDADTYANCCQFAFDNPRIFQGYGPNYVSITIALGRLHNGIMFKNVELILKCQ